MYCLGMVRAVMGCLIKGQAGNIMLPILRPDVLFLTGPLAAIFQREAGVAVLPQQGHHLR